MCLHRGGRFNELILVDTCIVPVQEGGGVNEHHADFCTLAACCDIPGSNVLITATAAVLCSKRAVSKKQKQKNACIEPMPKKSVIP